MINLIISCLLLSLSICIKGYSLRLLYIIPRFANKIPMKYHRFLYKYNRLLLYFIDDICDEYIDGLVKDYYTSFTNIFHYRYYSYYNNIYCISNIYNDVEGLLNSNYIRDIYSEKSIIEIDGFMKNLELIEYRYTFLFTKEMKILFNFYKL